MKIHHRINGGKQSDPHLGIDFGGVIIPLAKRKGREDTQFEDSFLLSPPQSHAFDKIQSLVKVFGGKVWIVSKAGERIENLTRIWMAKYNFFLYTGMAQENLYFCRSRIEKQPICERLRITHFIDDRIHIMQILKGTVPYLFLFGNKEQNRSERKWTVLVENWNEAHNAVIASLGEFKNKHENDSYENGAGKL